jgi:hypothetical protein
LGHEERFPPTRLSSGCGFRKETIAECAATDEMADFSHFERRRSTYWVDPEATHRTPTDQLAWNQAKHLVAELCAMGNAKTALFESLRSDGCNCAEVAATGGMRRLSTNVAFGTSRKAARLRPWPDVQSFNQL